MVSVFDSVVSHSRARLEFDAWDLEFQTDLNAPSLPRRESRSEQLDFRRGRRSPALLRDSSREGFPVEDQARHVLSLRSEGVCPSAGPEHDERPARLVGEEVAVRGLPCILEGGLRGPVLETPLRRVPGAALPLSASALDDPAQIVEDPRDPSHELGSPRRRRVSGREILLDRREPGARGMERDRKRMLRTRVEEFGRLRSDALEDEPRPSGGVTALDRLDRHGEERR
jgi:hypothetical protein